MDVSPKSISISLRTTFFEVNGSEVLHAVNKIKKQTGIQLDIWAANLYEQTSFKEEFTGINFKLWDIANNPKARQSSKLPLKNNLKLALYYWYNFVKNPYYLNSSLIDTFTAYISYYFVKKNHLNFYHYIKWDDHSR